jgi:hypothetical protein
MSHTYLEASNFLLNIVGDVSVTCAISDIESAQLALESDLVQDLTNAHTAASGLVTVARTDTLTGGADLAAAETLLLETIDNRVKVEADVRTVRDKDALSGTLQSLGLDSGEFLEETRDVEHGTGTNEVDTFRRDQTGGKDVEVVGDILVNDRVTGICNQLKRTIWSVTTLGNGSVLNI